MKLRTEVTSVDMNVLVVARRDGTLGPKVKEWNGTCRNGTPRRTMIRRCRACCRADIARSNGGITLDGATMFSVAEVLSLPQARALLGGHHGRSNRFERPLHDGPGLPVSRRRVQPIRLAAPDFAGPALSTAIRGAVGIADPGREGAIQTRRDRERADAHRQLAVACELALPLHGLRPVLRARRARRPLPRSRSVSSSTQHSCTCAWKGVRSLVSRPCVRGQRHDSGQDDYAVFRNVHRVAAAGTRRCHEHVACALARAGSRGADTGAHSRLRYRARGATDRAAGAGSDSGDRQPSTVRGGVQSSGACARVCGSSRGSCRRHARLDFPPGSFDLVWCEGAIYVVGFETRPA